MAEINARLKKIVQEEDVEEIKSVLTGWGYFGDIDSFFEFKELVEYAQKNILNLFDEDDGKEFTKDFTLEGYRKVVRLMMDNFSQKKYDAVIDIGMKVFGQAEGTIRENNASEGEKKSLLSVIFKNPMKIVIAVLFVIAIIIIVIKLV